VVASNAHRASLQLHERVVHSRVPPPHRHTATTHAGPPLLPQMMLLSDGSVTRHLQLLTGQPIQVVRAVSG
jgi:hypothetical protein